MQKEVILASLQTIAESDRGKGPEDLLIELLRGSEIAVAACAEYLYECGIINKSEVDRISQTVGILIQEISVYLDTLSDEKFEIVIEGFLRHVEELENKLRTKPEQATRGRQLF